MLRCISLCFLCYHPHPPFLPSIANKKRFHNALPLWPCAQRLTHVVSQPTWHIRNNLLKLPMTKANKLHASKFCSETIHAVVGASSNLIRHLKRKHEREYTQQEKGLASQPNITSAFTTGCSSVPVHRKAALDDAII